MKQSCPICNSSSISPIFSLYDDRYGFPGDFQVYRCCNCNHIYNPTYFEKDVLQELYTHYYPRSSISPDSLKIPKDLNSFSLWLNGEYSSPFRWIPSNVSVLDIGCGTGENMLYLKRKGCEVYGEEVDQNIQRFAKQYNLKVHHGIFDYRLYKENFFDYVILEQVVEHLYSPDSVFAGIRRILKNNGQIIISFPNANGWGRKIFKKKWIHWHMPYHVNFFSLKSLNRLLKREKLNIHKAITVTHSDWLFYQLLHNHFYPNMRTPSKFWTNTRISSYDKLKKYIIALPKIMKLYHVITRFFDMLNMGDNLLVIIKKIV